MFAALLAPWFAFVVAEPVPVHDCPMHSLHPAAAHSAMSQAMSDAGQSAPMAQGETGTTGTTHDPSAPGHSAHHQCCCLGRCCAASFAELARVPQLASATAASQRETPSAPRAPHVAATADHVLPFANGPPAARA